MWYHLGFWESGHNFLLLLQRHFGVRLSVLTILPLWSCPLYFILLPTSSQSRTPLPRVIEPPPPSPTSTEGPDATDSDSSVYTASSSSSSFSFSSSSSLYATSSSSTSDKVSQLDTVNRLGGACLSGHFWLSSFFLLSFACSSQPMHRVCPAYCYFSPLVVIDDTSCPLFFSSFPVIFFPPQKWDAFERR